MFEFEITELAQLELEEAYLYYEAQREGLGDDMILCYEEALYAIKRNPYFGIRLDDIRAYKIRRFPYLLFYRIVDSRIIVIAFFFGRRNPRRWQSR